MVWEKTVILSFGPGMTVTAKEEAVLSNGEPAISVAGGDVYIQVSYFMSHTPMSVSRVDGEPEGCDTDNPKSETGTIRLDIP